MKSVGIIGGIAPESTIEYYRQILRRYRERGPAGAGNPSILINSIDLDRMLSLIDDPAALVEYLSAELQRLASAGVDFAVFASNTPHIVFDELARRSPVPLISIIETAAAVIAARSIRKPALLGTRFTMQGSVYPAVFARRGIKIVIPESEDQSYVHDKYMSELVNGKFLPETREGLLRVIDRLRDQHAIDAVILGGTELPLLLRDAEYNGLPLFDTTRMHVEAIVRRLLE